MFIINVMSAFYCEKDDMFCLNVGWDLMLPKHKREHFGANTNKCMSVNGKIP